MRRAISYLTAALIGLAAFAFTVDDGGLHINFAYAPGGGGGGGGEGGGGEGGTGDGGDGGDGSASEAEAQNASATTASSGPVPPGLVDFTANDGAL